MIRLAILALALGCGILAYILFAIYRRPGMLSQMRIQNGAIVFRHDRVTVTGDSVYSGLSGIILDIRDEYGNTNVYALVELDTRTKTKPLPFLGIELVRA
jgi:hypothetical protein